MIFCLVAPLSALLTLAGCWCMGIPAANMPIAVVFGLMIYFLWADARSRANRSPAPLPSPPGLLIVALGLVWGLCFHVSPFLAIPGAFLMMAAWRASLGDGKPR